MAPTDRAATPIEVDDDLTLWKLPEVLRVVPVSRSTWFEGVKSGRFPQPLRLSQRLLLWRAKDIRALITRLTNDAA
jgi:predicted DNA-binding transcriptional regulator AlpA